MYSENITTFTRVNLSIMHVCECVSQPSLSHNSLALACSFKRDFNHVCCVTFVYKGYYFLNQTLINFAEVKGICYFAMSCCIL